MFSKKFISAEKTRCTLLCHVNAPYIRKTFFVTDLSKNATLTICGLGYYRLFINGNEITRSFLSSYTANPDEVLYYDEYDIKKYLTTGKNVLGVILGNGFLNCIGGYNWDFDKASFTSAPKTAFSVMLGNAVLEADGTEKTHPSPITFDDLRAGERYDANLEIANWSTIDYDDSDWQNVISATTPLGEPRICNIPPVIVEKKVSPVSITEGDGGYIYDFGVNTAGIFRLKVNAKKGQVFKFTFTEVINDLKPDMRNISFWNTQKDYNQCVIYTAKEGLNVYAPSFCYMGYRYVFVEGVTKEQADKNLITMLVTHTEMKRLTEFNCSDEIANAIYENALNSDTSNFLHIPTDCPQREKNGWTGDVALSAEQLLLNFDCSKSLAEWTHCITKAQRSDGVIPCIIPTAGWGYGWGTGPNWDLAYVETPYQIYKFTGDLNCFKDNADGIFSYIKYLETKRDENGLMHFGLGDWCQVNLDKCENYSTPLVVTDTIASMQICRKAAFLYGKLSDETRKHYCDDLAESFKSAFRKHCVDENLFVLGKTQTGLAVAIFNDIFNSDEKPIALKNLISLIKANGERFDVGVLGNRALFRVLSDNKEQDLAYKLITQKAFPSFGYHVSLGATSLFESFYELNDRFEPVKYGWLDILSQNHHFWGDVSAFFVEYVGGINVNPDFTDPNLYVINPRIVSALKSVTCSRETIGGKLAVSIEKSENAAKINITVPTNITAVYIDENKNEIRLNAGENFFTKPV